LFVFNDLNGVSFRRFLEVFVFGGLAPPFISQRPFSWPLTAKAPARGAQEKREPALLSILKNGNTMSAGLSRKCRFFLSSA
jgi:hypothetical protein